LRLVDVEELWIAKHPSAHKTLHYSYQHEQRIYIGIYSPTQFPFSLDLNKNLPVDVLNEEITCQAK